MSQPPNILWICTDQQRWDTLGVYGNDWVKTPNIDRLAESGTTFDWCYSQSSVCTPSRSSFLTGRYPRTCRGRQNGANIPPDELLITKQLADAGYLCGLSGKLHISACNEEAAPFGERRIEDGYAVFDWSHHPGRNWPNNQYINWLEQNGLSYQSEPYRGSPHVSVAMDAPWHQTTWCVNKAMDFINARAGFDGPWLYSVNIFDPHHAFDPPREYLERYLDRLDDLPLPNFVDGELANKPNFQRIDHEGAYATAKAHVYPEMSDYDHRLIKAAYFAMCDLIDDQVGRLLTHLKESGQAENTIVIFMSDHGEMLGDHGIYWKGPHMYECALRVPLIVSWPGRVGAGVRSGALVELSDIAPTILDACGQARPPGMQALSLWPILTEQAEPHRHREDIYSEYYNAMPWHIDPSAQVTMVRTRNAKLVVAHGTGSGELYDLRADPGENTNLWDSAEHRSLKLELYERLADRMAFTVDPLPERLSVW